MIAAYPRQQKQRSLLECGGSFEKVLTRATASIFTSYLEPCDDPIVLSVMAG